MSVTIWNCSTDSFFPTLISLQFIVFLLKFHVRNHLHKPLVTNRLINYYTIYHSMIGVIHKGLCNHPHTPTFDSPLLFKLDSALSRKNLTAAIANILLLFFFALRV